LFYRLNVISIALPALRDRRSDIPHLVNVVLRRLAKNNDVPAISAPALELLMQYDYPGNVRELENILERALVLGGHCILPENLPECVQNFTKSVETTIVVDQEMEFPVDLDRILSGVERRYLEKAMIMASGLRKNAAELLGINFRSLRYRLDKFGEGNWWERK